MYVIVFGPKPGKCTVLCHVIRFPFDGVLFQLLYFIVDFLKAEGYGIKIRVEDLGDICYA